MTIAGRVGWAVLAAFIPVALYSSSTGPVIRVSGAPGDATCNQGGCHSGVAENLGGGSVVLTASGGSLYVPGHKQTLTLKITDARAKVFGFQMSARVDSNAANGQGGTFTEDSHQKVLCDNSILRNDSRGCPSIYPVEFLEHGSPYPTGTITAMWTAPASDVGPVTIYVAANAANGDGGSGGDHIYTSSLQLYPPAQAPVISATGVVSASAFRPSAGTAAGTLLEIYGQNLASSARTWQGSDFQQGHAPTALDQVSATIGGKDAYVAYVSAGQVNIQVPDGVPVGPGVPLVLKNSGGFSAPYLLNVSGVAPAILAPPEFRVNGKQYAAALLPDGSYAAPLRAIDGVKTRSARAGEVVVLYGIGMGAVTPDTAAGFIANGATQLASSFSVLLGSSTAPVQYAGLAPGYTGLYQVNVQIPELPPGDYPLTVQVADVTVSPGVISIGQ